MFRQRQQGHHFFHSTHHGHMNSAIRIDYGRPLGTRKYTLQGFNWAGQEDNGAVTLFGPTNNGAKTFSGPKNNGAETFLYRKQRGGDFFWTTKQRVGDFSGPKNNGEETFFNAKNFLQPRGGWPINFVRSLTTPDNCHAGIVLHDTELDIRREMSVSCLENFRIW